jgi:CysZ protein
MDNSIGQGIRDLRSGFNLAFRPGIRLYVILPLLVNFLLFASGTVWLADYFGDWLNDFLSKLPEWLQFLRGLFWAVFVVGIMLTAYYAFTVLARLIAAPFNSLLAERVEKELTGKSGAIEESIASMVVRSIRRELVKLLYMLPRLFAVLLLSAVLFFIPGLNALIPLLWFLFGAWILCLEYLDYNSDNHGLSYRQTKTMAQQQRQRALGLGGAIALLTSFPLVNLVIMPVAVCAGTAWWVSSQKPQA